jgi:hypothetical protein
MDDTHEQPSIWSINGTLAKLHCGALSGQVDAARPNLGLQQVIFARAAIGNRLFRPLRASDGEAKNEWPLPLTDVYTRGHDLVASYGPTDDWPYAPIIYWQANSLAVIDGVCASLSFLFSVQTHLLDTHPRLCVSSELDCSEQLHFFWTAGEPSEVVPSEPNGTIEPQGTMCCVLRRLDRELSYVEFASTTDFCTARSSSGSRGHAQLSWQLFSEFLEKGVIRRARIHAALLPHRNDIELAAECCAALEQVPLPLTA